MGRNLDSDLVIRSLRIGHRRRKRTGGHLRFRNTIEVLYYSCIPQVEVSRILMLATTFSPSFRHISAGTWQLTCDDTMQRKTDVAVFPITFYGPLWTCGLICIIECRWAPYFIDKNGRSRYIWVLDELSTTFSWPIAELIASLVAYP